MAEGRRVTRSMLKADLEASQPNKKLKTTDVKQYKGKSDKRKKSVTGKSKTLQKKGTESGTVEEQRPATERKSLYEIVGRETADITSKEDVKTCSIWSMCILESGDLLLVDSSNPLLKRMNGDTYEVRDILKLPLCADAVCTVNEVEAAMTLYSDRSIQFVSVQDELIPTRLLQLDHFCSGIGVLSGNLFIGDGVNGNVFIYDMDGIRLNKVGGESIFSWNREIVKSDDNTAVYVSDHQKGLIKLDANGEVIWKWHEKTFRGACGLCTDGNGSVFVTGAISKNVVQISPEGQCLGEVVPLSACIPMTSAVCFDKRTSTMFVAGCARNDILVYRLK